MSASRIDAVGCFDETSLRTAFNSCLSGRQLIAVSNRQPYAHHRTAGGGVHVSTPSGGLVTALEPVLSACAGTWVAYGGGSADKDFVDERNRVEVPPDRPRYVLRRVWIEPEEYHRYYAGLSNRALWPLFHETAVEPRFDASEWQSYQAVNGKFAQAVIQEATTTNPVILVQDYQLALLPGLLRARLPRATIVLFWHIPWPRAARFDICPWKVQIIEQMLEADILGFNTPDYCRNFLQSVAAARAETGLALSSFIHSRVRSYPESVEWCPDWLAQMPSVSACRHLVRSQYGIAEDALLGLGVDRWDFTKGIPQRLSAFESLLQIYPQYRGRVVLLQIAAPTRSEIPEYAALQAVTRRDVDRINERFASAQWRPIVFVGEERNKKEVYTLYRAADFCVVNSLHDGMNLVAKEFVSARDDEDGVLVLSKATGAARELREALQVDPTSVSDTAEALRVALQMPKSEKRERMIALRATVKENNVYRWAASMLRDAGEVAHG